MEDLDEDLIDFGQPKRERKRDEDQSRGGSTLGLIEETGGVSSKNPPSFKRSLTSPVSPLIGRPPLGQFTNTSEDFLQKTRAGLLDLTEKGKATLQHAGSSMTGFRERMMKREDSWNSLLRSSERDRLHASSSRDANYDTSDDEDGNDGRSPPASHMPQRDSLLIETDQDEIENQLHAHFDNVRASAETVSTTTPKSSSDLWQSSGAKMTDDLRDYANYAKGWNGLCSRCEKFPDEATVQARDKSSRTEITFVTPLERIIYHAGWCRLCAYFLRNISRPENDPFQHPQVAEFLQPHLKGKHFTQWMDMSQSKYTDDHWPFGYGREFKEGAFHYLDPVALKHRAKRRAQVATSSLIPMMMKVALTATRGSSSAGAEDIELKNREPRPSETQKSNPILAKEDLIHPLECYLQVTIHTYVDILRSGQVQACLLGHGRGPGAPLTTLSQFPLRVQARPQISAGDKPLRYGNLINSRRINLNLSSTWLKECEFHHRTQCGEQSWSSVVQAPPSLRLIDVKNNCIVKTTPSNEVRFVALSYVWGQPAIETLKLSRFNARQLSSRGGLREFWHGVPNTVKDAIEVVNGTGEQYLWVDALCIVQDQDLEDDEDLRPIQEERIRQIAAMDWIYSKAALTIVAADSDTSMMGIAGVREHTRFLKQDTVQIENGVRLLTPTEVPQDVDEMIWNSRAWTFQERLLSRRLLIFQGGHMFWHCRRFIAHEDMLAEDKGGHYSKLPWLTLRKQSLGSDETGDSSIVVFPDHTTHLVRSQIFMRYAELIEQYTDRELTNDDDILAAMGGLLHIFRQLFKYPMRYGLPEILFDIALLWQPTAKLERRDTEKSDFPSWSWAGWKGRIKYEEPFQVKTDELLGILRRLPISPNSQLSEERIRPLVRWHVKHKNTSELTLLNKSGLGIPFFAKNSTLPEEWDRHPFPSGTEPSQLSTLEAADLPPTMLASLCSRHLLFRTSILSTPAMSLGKAAPQMRDALVNPDDPPLRYTLLLSARKVGTLLLDGEATPKLSAQKHDFVVLSETQYYGLDYEPAVEGYPLYNVMLVEWNEERTAAKRLGIGKVDKVAWKRAGPRLGIVCLE
ncbi:heterokaryon incompatibility protein-domain-containing protein [Bisporella sp. PMI_857]|nr:heterokaryon incompatibility protein-domain-containing protein [Bisporella sp. PMI_857]